MSGEIQRNIQEAASFTKDVALGVTVVGILLAKRYPKTAAAIAGLAGIATVLAAQPSESTPNLTSPAPIVRSIDVNSRRVETSTPNSALFKDAKANEIAQANGIDIGSFFLFKKETLDNLDAFLGPDLYPIYPPSVIEQQDLIYQLSEEFNVPPNVAATIMTIESAGTKNTPSYVGAQGLFQVMPPHFYEEFGEEHVIQNPQIMTDPYTNGKLGMRFFVNYCLTTARKQLVGSHYGPDHVSVFARALTAYNAGPGTVRDRFHELPEETKFYGDHFIRFALTAQIAAGLRDSGYSDPDIVRALTLDSNTELDARMRAIQVLHDEKISKKQFYTYAQYESWLREASFPIPGTNPTTGQLSEIGKEINNAYEEYKKNPVYTRPLSVGLRFWVDLGGINLLDLEKVNTRPENYLNMQTKRNPNR